MPGGDVFRDDLRFAFDVDDSRGMEHLGAQQAWGPMLRHCGTTYPACESACTN